MRSARIAASIILTTTFSMSAMAKDLIELSQLPEWFGESWVTESQLTETTNLKLEAFGVDIAFPGKATFVESGEDFWYYSIDISSGSPIECYTFTSYDGPANSLHSIEAQELEQTATGNNMALANTFNFAIDAGLTHGSPYLQLDTLYILEGEKGKLIGVVKGLSAETEQGLHVCLHNEVGYRKTFTSVFNAYVGAFVEKETNAEFFEPVYQVSMGGMPVGYTRERYTIDQDGDIEIVNDSAYLFPVSANEVSRSDSVSRSWSRPDGSVINATEYAIENGAVGSNFTLQFSEDAWHANGEMQGKQVQATLEHKDWLLSGIGSYIETAKLMNSNEHSSEFHMWASEADPTSAIKVVLSKLVDDPYANILIDMGVLKMKFMADDDGILRHGTLEQGPLQMTLSLLRAKGTPKLP